MALANYEIYMRWQIQRGRLDATAENAIERAAALMSLPAADLRRRLRDVLEGLLDGLPEAVLDEVLPAAIEEHYGLLVTPPTATANHPGADVRGSGPSLCGRAQSDPHHTGTEVTETAVAGSR